MTDNEVETNLKSIGMIIIPTIIANLITRGKCQVSVSKGQLRYAYLRRIWKWWYIEANEKIQTFINK
jgi:hypothetical protein